VTARSRMVGMVHHIVAEVALTPVCACIGMVALNVAIFPAGDIFGRADRDIAGAAERIVVAA
jgi:hypothetical protein